MKREELKIKSKIKSNNFMIKSNKTISRTNSLWWLRNRGEKKRKKKWIREEGERKRSLLMKKFREILRICKKYLKWRKGRIMKMSKAELEMKLWRNRNLIWGMKDWLRVKTADFNLKSMMNSRLILATLRKILCSLENLWRATLIWWHLWRAMQICPIDKEIRLSPKPSSSRVTLN